MPPSRPTSVYVTFNVEYFKMGHLMGEFFTMHISTHFQAPPYAVDFL